MLQSICCFKLSDRIFQKIRFKVTLYNLLHFKFRPDTWCDIHLFLVCKKTNEDGEVMLFITAWKVAKYGISGPYFPAFGLNTQRYFVSFRIQSECGKIRPRNNSYVDTFQAVYVIKNAHSIVQLFLCQHILILLCGSA